MIKRFFVSFILLALASAASAHHAGTAYDKEHPVEITGVVKVFKWLNPHAFMSLEVPRENGGTDLWEIEGPSIMMLSRNGWKSTSIAVGEKVRVLVAPKKDGSHGGSFMRVFLPNGTVLETGRIQ